MVKTCAVTVLSANAPVWLEQAPVVAAQAPVRKL